MRIQLPNGQGRSEKHDAYIESLREDLRGDNEPCGVENPFSEPLPCPLEGLRRKRSATLYFLRA
ncbi:MAG: hypothetical protein AAF788_03635 [Pseudomonadota bacterium]